MVFPFKSINGIQIGNSSINTIIARVDAFFSSNKRTLFHITNLNPEIFILAKENLWFRSILNTSDEQLLDGIGVKLLAYCMGLPSGEKLAGTDLMLLLLAYAARKKKGVFFLGGADGTANKTMKFFQKKYPGLHMYADSGASDIEKATSDEKRRLLHKIQKAHPDFLFVALGPPKQELWIYQNRKYLSGIVCMGVGGSFNFFADTAPRAPLWAIKLRIEWLWRFIFEPKRTKRKIVPYLKFVLLLLKAFLLKILNTGKSAVLNISQKVKLKFQHEPVAFLLAIVLLLIRLPPLVPPFGSNLIFLSTNIARILIGVCIVIMIFQKIPLRMRKAGIILSLLFFFSHSLSILNAANFESFFYSYKNLVFSILLYPIAYMSFTKKNKNAFLVVFLVSASLSLIFQLITYFLPSIANIYIKPFMYESYWQFQEYQISRGRYFGDSFEETLIPLFFFIFFFNKRRIFRGMSAWLVPAILLMTLISNWRTKFIMLVVSGIGSVFIYRNFLRKYFVYGVVAVFFIMMLGNQISLQTIGSNIYDRFFNEESGPFVTTSTESRYAYWQEAYEIGLSSPIIGVGLGNFFDNLSGKSQANKLIPSLNVTNRIVSIDDPHNVFFATFVYSGIFGLVTFILLLGYFGLRDIAAIMKHDYYLSSLILSFWVLFVFSLLNPTSSFSYLGLFWLLRGFIEKATDLTHSSFSHAPA